MRTPETFELLKNPNAFTLLTLIALRAWRSEGFNINGLSPGEALIGDYESCGLTEQKYRTAKKNLEKWKFITTKVTTRGTIAKLLDTRVYDVNFFKGNEQGNEQITNKQRLTRSKENKEGIYIPLFDHWNSLKIISHRKLTEKMRIKIRTALKDYSESEIKDSMQNYAEVLKSDRYYWTHKWTLTDFLQRGLQRFLSEAEPLNNFLKGNDNDIRESSFYRRDEEPRGKKFEDILKPNESLRTVKRETTCA